MTYQEGTPPEQMCESELVVCLVATAGPHKDGEVGAGGVVLERSHHNAVS